MKRQVCLALSVVILISVGAFAQTAGFQETLVSGGLTSPTAMEFAPDGRLFVSEKAGHLRIIKNGTLLPADFVTVSVNSDSERGLLGIAFDSGFAANRFVYVYYTRSTSPIKNRVSRFTASAADPDLAELGSETVILDDIASDAGNHNGGAIHFGLDGKLYVAIGDGGATSSNSQSLATLSGKLLRINADGTIPPDNPFVGTAGARGEIWAWGLRNPFTFAVDPAMGTIHINDVGQNTWEEINLGIPGANYGWPACEGLSCGNDPNFTNPIYTYDHSVGQAITGGAFYRASQFPMEYFGSYFFSDYLGGFIKRLDTNNQVSNFWNPGNGPVDLKVGPDGALYYLSIFNGQVFKIQAINQSPTASFTATPSSGVAPLSVLFNGSASSDPDGDTLTYAWDFGDGSPVVTGVTTSHIYQSAGSFTATLTVDDGRGGTGTASQTISVSPPLPVLTITATDPNAAEAGLDTGTFTITRTGASTSALPFTYTISGTATNGTDYALLTGSATVPIGAASMTITVTPIDDPDVESGGETVIVTLAANAAYTIGSSAGATITIADDDVLPVLTITATDAIAVEAGSDTGTFMITRTGPTIFPLPFMYTISGTATNGTDYATLSGSATIPIGAASTTITVTPIDDTVVEGNETVIATLAANAGYTIGSSASATITITEAILTITATDVIAVEAGSDTGTFTITRTGATTFALPFMYTTSGTATNGTDYTTLTGSATIPIGAASTTITVTPIDDTVVEGNETVIVTLAADAAYTVGSPASATITITEALLTITATDANAAEEGPDTGTFTITRIGSTTSALAFSYSIGGAATNGRDYTTLSGSATIPIGSASTTITVTPIDDATGESAETVIVKLAAGAAYLVGSPASATITIADNDPAAPLTYKAYTGTDARPLPPAPPLGPANSSITDPHFGSQILRVTDQNTKSGQSFISADSGFVRTWNADSTAIKLTGPHGDGYWLEFDPSTFKVGDGSSHPVPHQVSFGARWEWSALDPDVIYYLHGNKLAKYNKASGAATDLGGPATGEVLSYTAVVIGFDKWVCAAVGSGNQGSQTKIFCIDPLSPDTSKLIDVVNKTINGVDQSNPLWPTSAPGKVIGIHSISGGTGASWLEVSFQQHSWGGNGGAVFNLATDTWSLITNADIYWSGHVSMGNGKYVNASGSIDGRDSRGLLIRDPDDTMNVTKYQFVGRPPNTLNDWCDSDHSSWLNSAINATAPILISRYGGGSSCYQYAWTGEIDAVAVDGSNKVWRFAHNHNDSSCYYGESFAQISSDGKWALFSSYWDGALGTDNAFGCSNRIDTFIINLTTAAPKKVRPQVISQ